MAAGSTYTPIATTTLGSAASSYTFSSIPSTYTDLIIVANGTSSAASNVDMQFNSDTGTNYSWTTLYARSEGAGNPASARGSNQTTAQINLYTAWTSSYRTNAIIHIQNYSNTTTYKTSIARSATANGDSTFSGNEVIVNLWRSTSTINTIKLNAANFAAGTTLTLYGIAAA
jgi:hypothetical protein